MVDAIELEAYRTKAVIEMLSALGVTGKALIVTAEKNDKLVKSAANIPGVNTAITGSLNTYDLMVCEKCILTREAIEQIEEVYA